MTTEKVQLLVLLTTSGPLPMGYADSDRGKVSLGLSAARYQQARLAHGHRIVELSQRRASWWMCHQMYAERQMMIGHALARLEGRTSMGYDEWRWGRFS
jgi:hypothetical protein